MGYDILAEGYNFIDLLLGEVERVDKMFHIVLLLNPLYFQKYQSIHDGSDGFARKRRMRSISSFAIYPSSAATSTSASRLERL